MKRVRPVEHVVEQLWAPALETADVRVVEDAGHAEDGAEWRTVERYWLVPRASSARLLVPFGPRAATSRLLTNYRDLRPATVNSVRFALGSAARLGLPLARSSVAVQVRRTAPEAAERLPLARLSALLGRQLFAATGVRTGDNRKTTLHLVDATGAPVGYAKIGWNAATDAAVANEGRSLDGLDRRPGPTAAPRVIARLDYEGHPVIVTEPLPLDARGHLTRVAAPSAQEMYHLTPVVRQAAAGATGHLQAMSDRLRHAAAGGVAAALATEALALAATVAERPDPLPVTSSWHGDMAPWNRARDASGRLWVWDWESSEPDALAGLDPMHWAFSSRRLATTDVRSVRLGDCLADADHYLGAAGVPGTGRPLVAAVYALTVVERACTIAAQAGTWAGAYIDPAGLVALLQQAGDLVARSGAPAAGATTG